MMSTKLSSNPFRFRWTRKWTVVLISFLFLVQESTGQYYLEDKACATFYTEKDFQGDAFTLKDRDQSVLLEEDQRTSESGSGWNGTGSISVMNGCVLEICTETYLHGNCQKLLHGEYPTTESLSFDNITSTSCNCYKDCKCSDIFMKRSSCARGYLQGGCKTCNSLYTDLKDNEPKFPKEFNGKVEAFLLRKGCTLTLYSEEEYEGDEETLVDETIEDYKGNFSSFECSCDDSQFEPQVKPPRPASYPPLIDIPATLDGVIKLLSNKTFTNHPGLRDAHKSLREGRSSRNAYILLLGTTGAGKSSAINLLFDNPNVTKVGASESTTTDIHEFRIPVPVDELGIANSELRVIDTPGLGDTRGLQQDATFLATLDSYLSTHEELKDRIPNVVLIFHKFPDNRFSGDGANFVQMLRGLDSVRERITDEDYSNVIFVFSHFCSETVKIKSRPEKRIKEFKSVIEEYSQFPKPIVISVAENKAMDHYLPMVNGFYKLPNNEYYPKNLFKKMELAAKKGGDPMGLSILRSAFRDSDDFNVTSHTFTLRKESSKFDYYFRIISNAFFSINETEVSKELQRTWDDKIETKLKKEFSSTLPYLQKALSMKNVNTKEDVPKTTREVIRLLSSIKNDGVTRELLKKSLNLEAPSFPQNTVVGYGYNVFKDMYIPKSPFQLGDSQGSDIGFLIPSTITCKLNPGSKQNFHIFEDRHEYITHRLNSLGIDGTIANESFSGELKPGHNVRKMAFHEDGCVLTGTQEFRLFDFVLNNRMKLTPQFEETVRALPPFNGTDHENVAQWNKFFDDYGTHVVTSIYGGGVIEIQLRSDKPYDGSLGEKMFDLVQFAEDMSFIVVDGEEEEDDTSSGNGTKTKTFLSEDIDHSLKFIGGDPAFHTNDLTKMTVEEASKLLTNWKKSLKFVPSILTTEMRLVPISQYVKKLGQNYSSEIDKATSLLFNSELDYTPPERDTSPGSAREDTVLASERLRIEAELKEKLEILANQLKIKELELEGLRLEDKERQRRFELDMKNLTDTQKKELLKLEQERVNSEKRFQSQLENDRRSHDASQKKLANEHIQNIKKLDSDHAYKFEVLRGQIERDREAAQARACGFKLFGMCLG